MSQRPRGDCCGPFLSGSALPGTAEQLMRSRYSAFVECNEPYLRESWHPAFRPRRIRFNAGQRWLGLRIVAVQDGGADQDFGSVEFIARFKRHGRGHRLHEISRFERLDGRWVYCDGEILER